jgi:hypothetical protein
MSLWAPDCKWKRLHIDTQRVTATKEVIKPSTNHSRIVTQSGTVSSNKHTSTEKHFYLHRHVTTIARTNYQVVPTWLLTKCTTWCTIKDKAKLFMCMPRRHVENCRVSSTNYERNTYDILSGTWVRIIWLNVLTSKDALRYATNLKLHDNINIFTVNMYKRRKKLCAVYFYII